MEDRNGGVVDMNDKPTPTQMLKKYKDMSKNNYETVFITQVINDLYKIVCHQRMMRIPKHER